MRNLANLVNIEEPTSSLNPPTYKKPVFCKWMQPRLGSFLKVGVVLNTSKGVFFCKWGVTYGGGLCSWVFSTSNPLLLSSKKMHHRLDFFAGGSQVDALDNRPSNAAAGLRSLIFQYSKIPIGVDVHLRPYGACCSGQEILVVGGSPMGRHTSVGALGHLLVRFLKGIAHTGHIRVLICLGRSWALYVGTSGACFFCSHLYSAGTALRSKGESRKWHKNLPSDHKPRAGWTAGALRWNSNCAISFRHL